MRRREFITLLGGAAAASSLLWPRVARAQQPERMRRLGVLMSDAEGNPEYLTVFLREFQRLGWTEGRNVRIDYRWSAADPERMRAHAAELIGLAPDVIWTTSNQSASILGQQTRTVPIVFAPAGDPLGTGLISNMARPGGNITGFARYEHEIAGKWLELLKEVAPRLTRVAALYTPGGPASLATLRLVESVAALFRVEITAIAARDPDEIERGIDAFSREPNGGLVVLSGPAIHLNRHHIIALAARHRLPAIYSNRVHVINGGLMSYGSSDADFSQRAASYVDRILKGEKPGDLPVQGPTRFQLVVNLKTAKAMGLTISETFLVRADEVIE